MEATHQNVLSSLWFKWLMSLVVPALVWLIPLSDVYTEQLRLFFVITIFIIMVIAFELFEMLIPSIMLPTLYFLSGLVPLNVAFASWTNSTVWMVLGALILANVLEECGLLTRIALWCIRKCGGSFTGTLYGVFITGMVISTATFGQAFIVMMTLTYGICRAMKLERSDYSALMCFVGMMGGITTLTFLYNPAYLALGEAGIRVIEPDFSVLWYEGFMYNGVLVFLFFGLIWLLTKLFKTKDVSFEGGREYFDREYEKLGPMSGKEKRAVVILLLLMAFLFTTPWHKIPAAYGFMTFPYLLFCPGINVGSFQCTKKTNFSIVFFISSCLGIGIVGDALGTGKMISALVSPMMADATALVALLIMITFGVVANLFMTPFAMMAALSMPFAKIGLDIGIDPLATVMALMMSTDMIFFPHEVTGCLLMYSFGLISMKNFVRLNALKTGLMYLFFALVMFPLWNVFNLVH